jgi:hypothetical protein
LKLFFIILFFLPIISCGAQPDNDDSAGMKKLVPVQKKISHSIGSTVISLKSWQYGDKQYPVFLVLHADEFTASASAKMVLEKTGGLLIELDNNNERLLRFSVNGQEYQVDPNRIFTRTGISQNLKILNGDADGTVIYEVQQFGNFILSNIPPRTQTIIALHNNEEGKLSVNSYAKAGNLKQDARQVNKNEKHDADNFFLTTDEKIYKGLKAGRYNAVLQHNKRAKDDGSLSIYYGRKNKSYVNVEAETGQLDEQVKMIKSIIGSD